jgi:hypothetical protein
MVISHVFGTVMPQPPLLEPLAGLNHDLTHVQDHRIERSLVDVREMLNGPTAWQVHQAVVPGLAGTGEQGVQGQGQAGGGGFPGRRVGPDRS